MATLTKKKTATTGIAKTETKVIVQGVNAPEVGPILKEIDKALSKKKGGKPKKGKLPDAFKQKWLEALRSGEFKQTTGNLYEDGAYCVLGVAAKISGADIQQIEFEGELPHELKVPSILKEDAHGKNHDIANTLISMNDDDNMSFKRIANWIEKNL